MDCSILLNEDRCQTAPFFQLDCVTKKISMEFFKKASRGYDKYSVWYKNFTGVYSWWNGDFLVPLVPLLCYHAN